MLNAATSSSTQHGGDDARKNISLLSIAHVDEQHVLGPKTLSEWCRCTTAFNQEHQFPMGNGRVGVTQDRVIEYVL